MKGSFLREVTHVALTGLIFFCGITFVFASETVGTIESGNKLARVCHDETCSTYGQINFAPTLNAQTSGATAISVADVGLTGDAWGNELGWIAMDPQGAGVSINPATGALSGYAYASVGSWINFNPTGGGVTLVDNGSGSNFSGWAWVSGLYGGWIRFDCASVSTCVKTDWRATAHRTATTTSTVSSGGNGGSSGAPSPAPVVPTPETLPPLVPLGAGLPQNGTDGFGLVPAFDVPNVSLDDGAGTETGLSEENSGAQGSEVEESSSEGVWGNSAQDFFEPIVTEAGTVITREGEYALVVGGETTQSHSCFFCVVRRYDVAGNESGSFLRTGDSILKYGFVPKKMEIRIPTGQILSTMIPGDASIPDAEGTSSFLSVCVLWGIRRLLLARFFIV